MAKVSATVCNVEQSRTSFHVCTYARRTGITSGDLRFSRLYISFHIDLESWTILVDGVSSVGIDQTSYSISKITLQLI